MTHPITTPTSNHQIRAQFRALRAQGLRSRDIANTLGISEGQAMVAHAASLMSPQEDEQSLYSVTVLDDRWVNLLQGLESVGPVMALTRNHAVVHEKVGVYRNVSARGQVGMALGADIDLRLFLANWHAGMHVIEHDPQRGDQHSVQFFDARGQAVHKVHARSNSDLQALEALVQAHARPQMQPLFRLNAASTSANEAPAIDPQALSQAWSAMQDTHDFFDLLKRFGIDRQHSFQLMQGQFTQALSTQAVHTLLQQAAQSGLPIMVFVGNAGCLQIHTGPVHRITQTGPWLNVLDEGFNLHLRTDTIHTSWLVRKPTADGVVTSVELFDEQGEQICMFFGERKPGRPEWPAWRALAQSLVHPAALSLPVLDTRTAPTQQEAAA
jgi:putative hemin transport protein